MSPLLLSAAGLGWNLGADIGELLRYHFMVNAFEAGTVSAVLAGALGWFMVLRRQTFTGHTLAVVSFPGAAGAIWLGISAYFGYFGLCVAAALVIAALPRSGTSQAVSEESALIGTIQAFLLACGFLFVGLYQGFLNGYTALLFGSFLGVTDGDVELLLAVAVAALAALGVIGRPLLFSSLDPAVAEARGIPARGLSVLYLVLLALAVAEVSQVTGALLVFALLVMPAATAQRLTARPVRSLAVTVGLAVAITWTGLAVAYFSVYPIGFFVTSFGFAAYLVAVGVTAARAASGRRRGRLVGSVA